MSSVKAKAKQTPYMELTGIDRFFGITKALQNVSLKIYAGEVIGLVGPNGAGKSTMMKIITGVLPLTAGAIAIEGQIREKYTTKDSREAGISCAYQDLSLCTNLSVYENFALVNVDHRLAGRPGWRKKAQTEAKELLERYFPDNHIDVNRHVEMLTLAERQIVEICKTLMAENLRVLILDEPTSALSTDKAGQLHRVVKELSDRGIAIIYISHKLDEIRTVSDRIILLRNGENSGECDPEEITTHDLIQMMGGEAKKRGPQEEAQSVDHRERLVEIRGLTGRLIRNINMHVDQGEIVGISGLVGSGQTELLNAVFQGGRRLEKKGKNGISINGTVAYVSGDREKEGVFQLWDIFDNILIANLDQVKSGILLDRRKSEQLARRWYDKLKFRAEGVHSPIMSLSGGNQQKALIARGIASGAEVILLNDPTAGVDIETKQEIYHLLNDAKAEGRAIILYSTEDSEIEICDRAYIMHEGAVTEELAGDDITVSNIVEASFREVGNREGDRKEKRRGKWALGGGGILLPVITMLFMILANAWMNPNILSYFGMKTLIGSAVPLVFAALGQMFIVASGDIDMGNGYSIGLVNVLVAVVLTANPLIGVVSLLLFIAAYMLMAVLIHVRSIPAIVVTLGAQFIWLGIALVFSPTPGGYCPEWLLGIYKYKFPIIPMPMLIAALAAGVTWYVLYWSKYGMILRGIGNNPAAVERSGWSYLLAKMTNYGLSAIMIILSGMTFTAVCLGADANSSSSYCMLSIATVILGGCEMSGGKVEPVGVVVGAIAMSFITALLTSMKVDSNFQTAVTGMILILVLAIRLITHKKEAAVN